MARRRKNNNRKTEIKARSGKIPGDSAKRKPREPLKKALRNRAIRRGARKRLDRIQKTRLARSAHTLPRLPPDIATEQRERERNLPAVKRARALTPRPISFISATYSGMYVRAGRKSPGAAFERGGGGSHFHLQAHENKISLSDFASGSARVGINI